MVNIQEDQILLYEELCGYPIGEDQISKATIKFRENIKLANYVAAKFSVPYDAALDKEDLFQEAYLGLWKACLRFDESKGYEFSTYAVPIIKGTILRSLRDMEALKTPRSYKDIRSALDKHGFTLPLSDTEIDVLVSEGKFSRKQILAYSDLDIVSLDSPIKKNDINGDNYSEIIPDKRRFESEFSEEELEYIIDHVVSYIKPQHQDLVEEWMYATLEGCKLGQAELSIKYNISQASVSRVLKSAINIVKMHGEEIRSLFGL